MKHVTIKDIAAELKLAISTVSRAFNDKYDIKPETRERVLKKAKEMGYSPNPIARKLVQQRSFNIGIVIPEFENAFFPQVIIGAQEVLHEYNYQVLIMQSNESTEVELKNVKTLVDNMVDGLIISISGSDENVEYYKDLIKRKMPIVFFNRVPNMDASKVIFNDHKWALFATEHLIRQGFKDILFVTGVPDLSLSKNRMQGFDDAHRKFNLTPGRKVKAGFTVEDGERLAKQLLDDGNLPEAILAANDACAIGIVHVLKSSGYDIPNDIAIVGFSESKMAPHLSPPLTSVAQPTFEIGKVSAELLLEQINKTETQHQTLSLDGKLNVRASSSSFKS